MIVESGLNMSFFRGKTVTFWDFIQQDSCLPVQIQCLFAPALTWVLGVACQGFIPLT